MKTVTNNDHRVHITKLLIRKSFTELLGEKPIHNISIKELCNNAQISRGTFYTHYQDIYDLLEQIEADMLLDFQKALEPLILNPQREANPVAVCREIFASLKENSDMCIIMLGDYSDKKFVSQLMHMGKEKCVEEYSKHFTNATRKQIEYYYSFVCDGCIGLLRHWVSSGMTDPTDEIAKTAEQIMLTGIHYLDTKMD